MATQTRQWYATWAYVLLTKTAYRSHGMVCILNGLLALILWEPKKTKSPTSKMSFGSSGFRSVVKLPDVAWAIHFAQMSLSGVSTYGIDSVIIPDRDFIHAEKTQVYMSISLKPYISTTAREALKSRWSPCLRGRPLQCPYVARQWVPSKFMLLI